MFGHDRGNGVLVALHGHGDEPAMARRWGRGIAPPGWEVVAPGAPTDDDGVRSWFSTGARGVPPKQLAAAVRRVGDVVDRLGAAGRPVVVAGFSQGGAVALSLSSHGIEPDAVIAICTFLPEVDGTPEPIGLVSPAPLLVIATAEDEDVPAFLGEDAARHLRQLGRPVDQVTLAGGHAVSPAVQAHAASWLVDAVRSGPRVTIGLPTDRVAAGAELVSGAAVAELSSLYERLGFHALFVTDHPAPDDRWLAAGGHHALEPTAVLSAAAMATTTIRLHTNVYVLPYRNTFLAAKSLATVDVLSGGRLVVGVAAGYLRPEFEALGVGFDDRAARLDEALELLPRIWTGDTVQGEGGGWRARGATSLPAPVQRPHPPIWIGGNSVAAMRRAAQHAQGWSPFATPAGASGLRTTEISTLEALTGRLERFRAVCEEAGRPEPLTTCFSPFSLPAYLADPDGGLPALVDEIAELAALGIDWISLMAPGSTRAEVRDRATALAGALALR